MTPHHGIDSIGHPVTRNSPCPCGSGKKYKKCCSVAFFFVTVKESDFEPGETIHWWFQGDIFPYACKETGYIRRFGTAEAAAAWAHHELGDYFDVFSVRAGEIAAFLEMERNTQKVEFD